VDPAGSPTLVTTTVSVPAFIPAQRFSAPNNGGNVDPLDGRVWRLGADEATTLITDRDLMLGAAHVPAGEYTLWTISNGDATELIVNHETGQWGTDYDASRDLGRTPMTVGTLDTPAEQLTLHIEHSELRFEWGTTVASVPIMVH